MCGQLNREGLLCSKCKAGYGLDLYSRSSSCVPCSGYSHWKWILYFVLLLTPLTIFFLIVIIFNVRATSPPFTAFVLFCQLFTNMHRMNPSPYNRIYIENYISPYVYKPVFTVIDVWSLDFFRNQLVCPICVRNNLSNIQVLIIELIPPVYIFILIVLTYMLIELHARNVHMIVQLWKPLNKCVAKLRRTYDPKASIFNAFATFLLLSYSSVLVVGFHSTFNVKIYTSSPPTIYRLYYDPNKPISSKLPHFIPVIILLAILTVSPILILILYPIKRIRKIFFLLCCKDIRCLKSFVDAFQGHYKDGTNGTHDYRAMASFQFIIRAVLVYNHWKDDDTYMLPIVTRLRDNIIVLICLSVGYLIIQPYKKKYMNTIEGLLYSIAAILLMLLGGFKFRQDAPHYALMYLILVFILLPSLIIMAIFAKRLTNMMSRSKSLSNIHRNLKNCLFKKKGSADAPVMIQESLPHRLTCPNEYTALLQ